MELKELTENVLNLMNVKTTSELPEKLFEVVKNGDERIYDGFCEIIGNDLSVDWMQMIFQYYEADRKEKMQDYTPKSLADFMGLLAGESECIIDMCAGSGALTIQKWNRNHNLRFLLYEYDEKVIPFLLFNMAVRNILCRVNHADVLQDEIFHAYMIKKGERYGILKEVSNEHSTIIKSAI